MAAAMSKRARRDKYRPKERKQMSAETTALKSVPPPAATPTSAAAPNDRQAATIRYLDRAEMGETFADSITGLRFDGQTLRIEFGVTRFDEFLHAGSYCRRQRQLTSSIECSKSRPRLRKRA
jgi:hypothetical protein